MATEERGLGSRIGGNHHSPGADGVHQRDGSGYRPHGAVEAELADKPAPRHRIGRELAAGDQEPDRYRKVERRPTLADHAAGRQVDGDALEQPPQAAREHRGPHPVTRFATSSVGKAHHVEGGQAIRYVHLDRHGPTVHAEQSGGGDAGDHRGLLAKKGWQEGPGTDAPAARERGQILRKGCDNYIGA